MSDAAADDWWWSLTTEERDHLFNEQVQRTCEAADAIARKKADARRFFQHQVQLKRNAASLFERDAD